ncbi:MAG: manganese efflux pump [Planctomycetaceae bacterium]
MNLTTMILLSLSVSVDVLALATALALRRPPPSLSHCLVCITLWSATATTMLLTGWLAGDMLLTEWLAEHRWLAGAGLVWIGLQMIFASGSPRTSGSGGPISIAGCLVHGLLVSIDTCVLGAALAMKRLPILQLAIIVSFVTATVTLLGFGFARHFQQTTGRAAEIAAGVFLLAVGGWHFWV